MTKQTKQRIGIVLCTILVDIALIWIETYTRCRENFKKAEAYYSQGNYKDALTWYESAIHMYTPFNGMIPRSAERMWQIAGQYEAQGDVDMALLGYRSLRSSFYAVRSTYTPYPEWIKKAEAKIQELEPKSFPELQQEVPVLAPRGEKVGPIK